MSAISNARDSTYRDLQTARRMLRERGIRATAAHARCIALIRLHRLLIDGRLQAGFPFPVTRQSDRDPLTFRFADPAEVRGAVALSPTPCKTFDWAIAGLGIEPSVYHFVDIGSGVGHALMLAARHPFRALTGVEFARELHEQAQANVAWLRAKGRIGAVDLRHESALETALPDGPCLVYLFCPFDERVMKGFVARLEEAVRRVPRPLLVLYVNPAHAQAFRRPGIRELALTGPARALIRLVSPYRVRAFALGPRI